MATTDKKRLRGHALDVLEKCERSLASFTSGASKGKEIEHFDKLEEREWHSFYLQVATMTEKLKKKLVEIFSGKKLSPQEMARLPESVRIILFPTAEEIEQEKHAVEVAKAYCKH